MNTQTMLSSSQIFRRASGRPANGTPLKMRSRCAMCSAMLEVGDLFVPITNETFGESFNNKLDIKTKLAGAVICGDCDTLWHKDFLQSYSKSYACADGVFKFASNEDVQAFFLRPPATPFVAIFSMRQQQHMIWRTPASYSQKVVMVRVDDEVLTINVERALAGVRAWKVAEARMKALGIKGIPASADRSLGSISMGSVRPDVKRTLTAESGASLEALNTLQGLGMGEWWALCALRQVDLDKPETWPRPVKVLPLAEPQAGE